MFFYHGHDSMLILKINPTVGFAANYLCLILLDYFDVKEMKWIEVSMADIKKISEKLSTEAPAVVGSDIVAEEAPKGAFAKMKAFVRKAVDCCIE